MAGGVTYTSDALIASVKRRTALGTNQLLDTDDDILAYLGDELSSTLMPLIHSVQQEHWVQVVDVPLVQGQVNYFLPVRGVSNGLRYISCLDNQGNEYNFPKLRPEQIAGSYSWVTPYATSALFGFYFEDDHLVVYPKSQVQNPSANSIRFRYERQPNQLCSISDAGQIVSLDRVANTIVVSVIPGDWGIGSQVDITQSTMPFAPHGDDITITNIDILTSTLTVDAIPPKAIVNDWISLSGTSPVAQIPYQLYPLLCQAAVCRVLASLADLNPYEREVSRLEQMKKDALLMLAPRDMGNTDTVINRDNFIGSGGSGWWAGGGSWGF